MTNYGAILTCMSTTSVRVAVIIFSTFSPSSTSVGIFVYFTVCIFPNELFEVCNTGKTYFSIFSISSDLAVKQSLAACSKISFVSFVALVLVRLSALVL